MLRRAKTGAGSVDMELREALEAFDDSFRAGDVESLAAPFAEDARLMLHQQPEIEGRSAIAAWFEGVLNEFDTSAYEPVYSRVDLVGDAAYVLGEFRETLRSRRGGPSLLVSGRIVIFWQRDGMGAWRITHLLTGRSAPDEEIPA